MTTWTRNIPTFVKFGQSLAESNFVRLATRAWRGSSRCCVIELGRGVRRISLWEVGPNGPKMVESREATCESLGDIVNGLQADLEFPSGSGVACELVIHPPWAVVKVFKLTRNEADSPTEWIANHRTEVFPQGLEDDCLLAWVMRDGFDGRPRMIVGLSRKSTVDPILDSIGSTGNWLERAIIGPLSVLDRIVPQSGETLTFAVEKTGIGSLGIWQLEGGSPSAWAELKSDLIPEQTCAGEIAQSALELLGVSLDRNVELPHKLDITPYTPQTRSSSRWRLPLTRLRRPTPSELSVNQGGTNHGVANDWLCWLFRCASLVSATAALLAAGTYGLSVVAETFASNTIDDVTALSARRDQLNDELDHLERKLDRANRGAAGVSPARLWFDIGSTRPTSLWLRQIKSLPMTRESKTIKWQLEGLCREREAANGFVDALKSRKYQTRLTKLERVDIAKLKDIPTNLKGDLFRFAVEVLP